MSLKREIFPVENFWDGDLASSLGALGRDGGGFGQPKGQPAAFFQTNGGGGFVGSCGLAGVEIGSLNRNVDTAGPDGGKRETDVPTIGFHLGFSDRLHASGNGGAPRDQRIAVNT